MAQGASVLNFKETGIRASGGEIMDLLKLKDDVPADLANSLKADEDRKSDHTTLVQVKENEGVATLTATIETNFRGDGAPGASSETEDHSRAIRSVSRRGRCFSAEASDEVDGMKRKRRRRVQRAPEAFARCRCAHDAHSCLYNVFQFTICFCLFCISLRKLSDDARVSSRVVLCFFHSTVCVDPFATRNSPFACWCRHSTCVTLFLQVRLVYLIFVVPQTQEQIVGCLCHLHNRCDGDTAEGANFVFFRRACDSTGGVEEEKACQSTGNNTGGRDHRPTAMLCVVF